jgi:hypothetical protein
MKLLPAVQFLGSTTREGYLELAERIVRDQRREAEANMEAKPELSNQEHRGRLGEVSPEEVTMDKRDRMGIACGLFLASAAALHKVAPVKALQSYLVSQESQGEQSNAIDTTRVSEDTIAAAVESLWQDAQVEAQAAKKQSEKESAPTSEEKETSGTAKGLAGLAVAVPAIAAGVRAVKGRTQAEDQEEARLKTFEKMLDQYPDAEEGRLVKLLADARHWAEKTEVDFDRCLEISDELHANEVRAKDGETTTPREAAVASEPVTNTNSERGEKMPEPARNGEERESDREESRKKPIRKFEEGAVRGFLWDNGEGREPTLTLARLYKDQESGEWRYTQSFRKRHLKDVLTVTRKADAAIEEVIEQRANREGATKVKAPVPDRDKGRER